MYPNYSIILDKGELYDDYVRHIYRALLSGPNSTFNCFIGSSKDDWDIGTEVLGGELIHNTTENYNNMVAAK